MNYPMSYRLLTVTVLMLFLVSCERKARERGKIDKPELRTHIKYPLLFVPGYGNSAKLWHNKGIISRLSKLKLGNLPHYPLEGNKDTLLKQQTLGYGGIVRVEDTARTLQNRINGRKIDFFTMSYSDSVSKIDNLSQELGQQIEAILGYTGVKKVVLIGYSMGGVVARNYVVKYNSKRNVKTLITISSPHQGSYLANVARSIYLLTPPNFRDEVLPTLDSLSPVPVETRAVTDLIISGQDGFLYALNQMEHPQTIDYHSVIAKSSASLKLRTFVLGLEKVTGYFTDSDIDLGDFIYEGDLVVSTYSQNMRNIQYIKNSKSIKHRISTIDGQDHFSILNQTNFLIRIIQEYIKI